jgi:glycosyltransferase involved in cell wall biosynthesis
MTQPKVSIVTISYNQCAFLERAIQSVLAQNYPEVEYIVVDPGSTDGSRDIIERYRSRISKLILEPDKGPVDGLNKGFSVATGEIYGYLNALVPSADTNG